MFEKPKVEKKEAPEEIKSEILLKFFRHSIKGEKAADDNETQLSPEGRELAASKAEKLENPSLAKAWGSKRIRTEDTASLMMDGDLEKEVDEALEEKGIGGISRVEQDPKDRLNFLLDTETVTGKEAYQAFGEGRYLEFIVNQSDDLARENNEIGANTTYSSQAANIASIIDTYIEKASDRWHEIYKADQEGEEQRKYPKDYAPKLERFLGSHQGVTESFLLKVIEKTKGAARRDELVQALGATGGFSETEGFDITIENNGDEKTVSVSFEKLDEDGNELFVFNHEVSPELLEEIISEGNLEED